jgi:hypothetical protein
LSQQVDLAKIQSLEESQYLEEPLSSFETINPHESKIIPIVNAKVSRGRKKTVNVIDENKTSLKTKKGKL